MEDIKNPSRNLMVIVASFLVLGQLTLTSPLEENPTLHCASNIASVMEPQEYLETVGTTPENVRSSKYCKEYFSVINVIKKVESSESTKAFLSVCVQKQIIPKTFQEKRKPYGLNDEETLTWNKRVFETDTCYVALAYLKTKRRVNELNQNLYNLKQCFLQKFPENEINLFEDDFNILSTNLKKEHSKSCEQKLNRMPCSVPIQPSETTILSENERDSDNNNNTSENDTTQSYSENETDAENNTPENIADESNNVRNKRRNRRWIPRSKYKRIQSKKLKARINFVYNFSSLELSDAAQSLLNKGLNFCPTPKGINTTQLYADMFRMERKFAWKHFFKNKSTEPKESEKFPFSTKSRNTNVPKEYPAEIKEFVASVKSELLGTDFIKVHPNLSELEREALEELIAFQKVGKIVIQPADKGSGICIFDREDYETEANRQLQDTLENEQGQKEHYYKKVPEKTIKDQFNLIKETLEEGVKNKYITKDFARNLLPQKPKAGSFYLLGKVHKQFERIPKGRPIISGCGTNTERISWLCDQMGKEFVKKQSSFIEDTPDLLRYFKEINENKSLPANCKPIALDLKSMYSNIPTEEGIETFRIELEKRQDKSIPTDFLIKLLRLVLQSNVFEFNKEFWIQLLGTAMGTRAAPTYTNIFMGNLENEMLNNCPRHLRTLIFDWKRFIDDILLLFLGTLEELDELFTYLNSYHPTMKFDNPEYDEQNNSTNFILT